MFKHVLDDWSETECFTLKFDGCNEVVYFTLTCDK